MGVGSMGGLYIGVSGLQVNQNALNTTAHNISNVDTVGYVRQQVLMTDAHYSTLGHTAINTMQCGIGTSIDTVRQVRDEFADKQYRLETGRQSYYEKRYEVTCEVTDYFGELEGSTFQNALTEYWKSLNELQKEPGSVTVRSAYIQNAQQMMDKASLIYKQIGDYQVNLNDEIMKQVKRINEIGKQLLTLNKQVVKNEANGVEAANDYRDQRNALLDELGKYVDIRYTEDAKGCVSVMVEGTSFVTADNVFELSTKRRSPENEMLTVTWKDHGDMELYNFDAVPPSATDSTDVGSLKGLLYARGDKVGNYLNMNMNATDYANDVATYTVVDLQSQFDMLMHNIAQLTNDILCPNKELGSAITATDGTVIAAGTKVLDTENAPLGLGTNGKPGTELFTRKTQDRYKTYEYVDGAGQTQTLYVYNEEDPSDLYSLYSIPEMEINEDVIKDPSLLPLSNTNREIAQDVVNNLLDAWNSEGEYAAGKAKDNLLTLKPNTLTKYNVQGYYKAMIGDIAGSGNTYNSIATNQATVALQVDNRRQQVAGVSSDDELSNMIMYQQAYNAASRYINVVSEMLDTLVNKL